jgi:ABC-2 type transport system permease protein
MTSVKSTAETHFADDGGLGPLITVGRPKGLIPGTVAAFRELRAHRELLVLLVTKEIKSRYNGSYLGILWSLLRPIVQLAIYYLFIGQVLGAAHSIPGFAIFVFGNLTIWGLFTETVGSGTSSILSNAGLVKKIYLPREIFPLTSLGSALFNYLVQFVILILATLVTGVFPAHVELLYVIPAVLLMSIYGLALGLALGALNTYLRDTQHLVEIAIMLMFWASPILYSLSFVHRAIGGTVLESLYLANPATLAAVSMQKAVWIQGKGDPSQYWPPYFDLRLVIAFVVGLALLWAAQRLFARLQGNFAQEL